MATVDTLMTAEEFGRMQGDPPSELVRGKVIEMNMPYPRHGQICVQVILVLGEFVRKHKSGHLTGNDSGVVTERNPDTVRGADVAFYSFDRVPMGRLPNEYLDVVPNMVWEVRSPSDRWGQLMRKVSEYLEAGVRVVCVVEPEKDLIHVHEADGSARTLTMDDELELPTVLPGFRVKVREFLEA